MLCLRVQIWYTCTDPEQMYTNRQTGLCIQGCSCCGLHVVRFDSASGGILVMGFVNACKRYDNAGIASTIPTGHTAWRSQLYGGGREKWPALLADMVISTIFLRCVGCTTGFESLPCL